jgi:hypothetical protein
MSRSAVVLNLTEYMEMVKVSFDFAATHELTTLGNTDHTPAKDRWNRLEEPADINVASREGRRLYVGGLPRFENQGFAHAQIRELFQKYSIEVISKPISAHESTKDKPGNHNYLFVDLASAAQANDAIQALDGIPKWGWNLKVSAVSLDLISISIWDNFYSQHLLWSEISKISTVWFDFNLGFRSLTKISKFNFSVDIQ